MKIRKFKEELPPMDLFTDKDKHKHQTVFYNPESGLNPPYPSAGLCNRCGACAQACPSYKALKAELYAPRGRHQLFRMILERKIKLKKNKPEVLRTAASCIMCGECMALCPVNAPAYKHMAELKRTLGFRQYGPIKNAVFTVLNKHKNLYFKIRNWRLKLQPADNIKALYLTSSYGLKNAKKTLAIIEKTKGKAELIKSGLFLTEAYLTQPLSIYKKTLAAIKKEYEAHPGLPLITDNIEEYRLLKQAQEFGEEYKSLADNLCFITELLPKQKLKAADFKDKKILLQNNNIFFCGDDILNRAAELFVCGKNNFFVEFSQIPSPGLLAYTAGVNGAESIKAKIVAQLAEKKADVFIVLSAADEKFFNRLLKKAGLATEVLHIARMEEYFYER